MKKHIKNLRVYLILCLIFLIAMIGLAIYAEIPWYWGVVIGLVGMGIEIGRRYVPFFD